MLILMNEWQKISIDNTPDLGVLIMLCYMTEHGKHYRVVKWNKFELNHWQELKIIGWQEIEEFDNETES